MYTYDRRAASLTLEWSGVEIIQCITVIPPLSRSLHYPLFFPLRLAGGWSTTACTRLYNNCPSSVVHVPRDATRVVILQAQFRVPHPTFSIQFVVLIWVKRCEKLGVAVPDEISLQIRCAMSSQWCAATSMTPELLYFQVPYIFSVGPQGHRATVTGTQRLAACKSTHFGDFCMKSYRTW